MFVEVVKTDSEKPANTTPDKRPTTPDGERTTIPEPPSPTSKSALDRRLLQEAASKDGDTDVAADLLWRGASLDCTDGDDANRTPLHKACASGTTGMVQFLIRRGAGTRIKEARDANGKSPLHVACLEREEDDDDDDDDDEEFTDSAARLLLFKARVNVNSVDRAGRTALHWVAERGKSRTWAARLLLRSGADVDLQDAEGRTPLHLCLVGKGVGVMDMIVAYGASVDMKNGRGATALHQACWDGWEEGVDVLLRHGADAEIKDHDGLTPVQVAKDAGASEIVRQLEESGRGGKISRAPRWPSPSPSPSPSRIPRRRIRPTDTAVSVAREEDETDETDENENENNKALDVSMIGLIPEPQDNIWAGVHRDNGDGFMLASYDNHDLNFAAKLETISPCIHEGKDMHEIQIKINFMRPHSMDYRIRYAKVDVMLRPGSRAGGDDHHPPNIRGIMPQADRMEVSEQEISSGQKFTVGAAGGGGPSNVNISMEGSKSRTATFKGVRIIHGAVKDQMHASWRLYEEPGSKSGLPEIVRLLLIVHCETEFEARLSLSVKACHFLTFGIPRTLTAPPGPSYTVPKLEIITAYEQASRLKQMLDVADRAATVAEEANKLEELFSRAMRGHKKRQLIMEAGIKVNNLQEWVDILEDSKYSDFRTLRDKLLEIDPEPIRRLRDTRRDRRRVRRRGSSSSSSDSERDLWAFPRRRRVSPVRPRATARIYDDNIYREDVYYGRGADRRRGDGCAPGARNALQSFSAVGPGYHVSRLA